MVEPPSVGVRVSPIRPAISDDDIPFRVENLEPVERRSTVEDFAAVPPANATCEVEVDDSRRMGVVPTAAVGRRRRLIHTVSDSALAACS